MINHIKIIKLDKRLENKEKKLQNLELWSYTFSKQMMTNLVIGAHQVLSQNFVTKYWCIWQKK